MKPSSMSHKKAAEEGEGAEQPPKEEKPPDGRLDSKADELLWEYAIRQDQHTYDQFSLAVVGIGALFFAYGSITTASLKGLVAIIGFAASLTLFDHMWGARQEYYCTRDELKGRNPRFFEALQRARRWSRHGFGRIYQPGSRLMFYFMGGVTFVWGLIIAYRVGVFILTGSLFKPVVFPGLQLPYEVMLFLAQDLLVIMLVLLFARKREDL